MSDESRWRKVGEKVPVTDREEEAIEEVLALAMEHVGMQNREYRRIFRDQVRAVTSGRQRWLASSRLDSLDVRYPALMILLDGLIADQGVIDTNHGMFTKWELGAWFGLVERTEEGGTVIRWPISVPWIEVPEEWKNNPGLRGEAVYRPIPEEDVIEVASRQPDWWESVEGRGMEDVAF